MKEKCEIVDRLEDQLAELRAKEKDASDHQKIRENQLTRQIEQLEERLRVFLCLFIF